MEIKGVLIISALQSNFPTPLVPSESRGCSDCEEPVWVSRASLARMARDMVSFRLLCESCFHLRAAREKGTIKTGVLKEVLKETRRFGDPRGFAKAKEREFKRLTGKKVTIKFEKETK